MRHRAESDNLSKRNLSDDDLAVEAFSPNAIREITCLLASDLINRGGSSTLLNVLDSFDDENFFNREITNDIYASDILHAVQVNM
jgi:catabolite regulation protein CreA